MQKSNKYQRYTLRLNNDLNGFITDLSKKRGSTPTDTIKAILGEERERKLDGKCRE